jgi:hypothetical protein
VATLLTGCDPVNCKCCVVDQAYPFKSIKYCIDRSRRHIPGLKRLVKLVSGTSFGSQLPQCDGAGHGLGVGITVF